MAQDTALSRRRQGFDSPTGYSLCLHNHAGSGTAQQIPENYGGRAFRLRLGAADCVRLLRCILRCFAALELIVAEPCATQLVVHTVTDKCVCWPFFG